MGLKNNIMLVLSSLCLISQTPLLARADCSAVNISANVEILGTASTGEQACSNAKRLCETRGAIEAAGSASERCAEACQLQGMACTFTTATPGTGNCTASPVGSFPLAGQFGCYYDGTFSVTCGCSLQ